MRDISSLNIDFKNKWDVSSSVSPKVLKVSYKLLNAQKRGIDIYDYKNVMNLRSYGNEISFSQYCDSITELESHKKEIERIRKISVNRRITLEPNNSMQYKLPSICVISTRIDNSKNKYQKFYDELFLPFFREYIEWQLSTFESPVKFEELYEVEIIKEHRHLYFKRPYQLFDILFNQFMTKKDKMTLLNRQYTLTHHIKNCDASLKSFLNKENIINIDEDIQKQILEKWFELNYKPGIKKINTTFKKRYNLIGGIK